MRWRCAARQSWPVLSRKFATDCFMGFFLLFFPCGFDVLPLCRAGWGNGFLGEFFLCFFSFTSVLIVSKLGEVCLFGSVVHFLANRSAVSFPCIPTREGTHWKAIVLPRPVFRYFTPLGPRNFCAPPHLFVFSYVQLSNSLSSF